MGQYYYTEDGYKKFKTEIERLDKLMKNVIAKEIAAAREHGDLKENAEYHAAKEKQALCSSTSRSPTEQHEREPRPR